MNWLFPPELATHTTNLAPEALGPFPTWTQFKLDLPHQHPPFSSRNWGSSWHSMCSYQGKMKPSLAHHLVRCFTVPGDVVIDPFSGAGTIPLEACLEGRIGVGFDISELGYILTAAKVSRPDSAAIQQVIEGIRVALGNRSPSAEEIQEARSFGFNGPVAEYFHADTLRELLVARQVLLETWDSGHAWALVFACLLHILHGNRPYALSRTSHPITPFKPTGPNEYRPLLPRLLGKVDRVLKEIQPESLRAGLAFHADAIDAWPALAPKADAIITSPPFFDSQRFYMTNWMRYWMSGWTPERFSTKPDAFLETKQRKSMDVYHDVFRVFRNHVKDSGVVVLHLGESAKCKMSEELARRAASSFDVVDIYVEDVEHCERHGVSDKGSVRGHSYLVLRPR